MEEIKLRFAEAIAEKLTAAPDGNAKSELLEELADNLYQRYLELTAAGEEPEAAFSRAMEDLGDVGELVDYLRSQEGDTDGGPDLGDGLGDLVRNVEQLVRNALGTAAKAVREAGDRIHINVGTEGRKTAVPGQDLQRVKVELPGGDVDISFCDGEDAVISGDLEALTVAVTEGTLSIRPTVPGFSLASTDVELRLPLREWESIYVAAANGDVELNGAVRVETVHIKTANGDVNGQLAHVGRLEAGSANGDVNWRGQADGVRVRTASGDILFEGDAGSFTAVAASGDTEFTGTASEIQCSSASGDVRLEIGGLPRSLTVNAQSGDCDIRLPEGPEGFTARLKTTGGDVDSEFPLRRNGREIWAVSGDGGAEYTVTTVGGDITLKKY